MVQQNRLSIFFNGNKRKQTINFSRRQYNQHNPRLRINKNKIEYTNEMKFLGVIIDKKFTWKSHIKHLKRECLQRMNLLKSLGHQRWGANKDVLLKLYQALI